MPAASGAMPMVRPQDAAPGSPRTRGLCMRARASWCPPLSVTRAVFGRLRFTAAPRPPRARAAAKWSRVGRWTRISQWCTRWNHPSEVCEAYPLSRACARTSLWITLAHIKVNPSLSHVPDASAQERKEVLAAASAAAPAGAGAGASRDEEVQITNIDVCAQAGAEKNVLPLLSQDLGRVLAESKKEREEVWLTT